MGKYLVSNKNQKVNRTTRGWHIKHRQGAHTNFQQHKTIYTYVYIITYIRYDTITISSCYINVFKTDWRIVPISRPRTIYNIKQNYETNCRANLLPRLLASCPVEIRILENWGKNWKTLTLHRILGFACIWAPKADWGSHSKLWIRTLVNQHHCMPDKHSHEAKCSVSRSIRSPKCSYCVKLLGEHVKQTWTPSHYKSEWIFFCHPTSCQGSRTQRQVSKQQVGLHSLYIRFTLAIHWQYCKPKQTTSVLQSYHGKATTTICIHLSQAPPSLESWAAVTSVAQRPCYGKKLCRFFNCVQVAACRSRMTVTSTCCMPCTTDRGLSSKPVESLVRDQNSTNVVSASLPASAANTISRMMTSKATKLKTVKWRQRKGQSQVLLSNGQKKPPNSKQTKTNHT